MPWATTTAPPTTAAVRRMRLRAMGMSVPFVGLVCRLGLEVGFDDGQDGLGGDSAARDELSTGMADGGADRCGPQVLPHQHRRRATGLDRLGEVDDVLL